MEAGSTGQYRGCCVDVLREIGVVTGDCCVSCHDDAAYGEDTGEYQLGEIELPGGDWVALCCEARTSLPKGLTFTELLRRLDDYDKAHADETVSRPL